MTIYETHTDLAPSEVVERARTFYQAVRTPYAAYVDEGGSAHLRLKLEVGEVMIGAFRNGESTRVRGSASRGSHLLTRFFASIAPAAESRREVNRFGRES
jgi:hypothetical protein